MQQVDVIWVFVAFVAGVLATGGIIWWRAVPLVDRFIMRRQMAWSQKPRL